MTLACVRLIKPASALALLTINLRLFLGLQFSLVSVFELLELLHCAALLGRLERRQVLCLQVLSSVFEFR